MSAAERIGFDARYVSDRYHGVGRFAFRLLEALVALNPDRQFVVFRGKGPDTRFDWRPLEGRPNVRVLPGPGALFRPQEQALWPLLLHRNRVERFFSPFFPAPLLSRLPCVITVHDLIFDRYPRFMPQRWAWPYYRALMSASTRRARRVVTVSRATAEDLARFYRVPAAKIAVVPEGVEAGFSPVEDAGQRRELARRLALPERFILAVGARRPHKNLALLVNAFADLQGEIPHQLVIAGPPDVRFPDEARLAAERCGLDGRVRFLDWVPEADLAGLYSLASAVVFPSLVEGFGLPLLEAMSCGTPVLAANASALPEVAGEAGLLFDPHDRQALAGALRSLLADEALQRKLRLAGLRRAAGFTWQAAARRILEIIDETPP